MQKLRIGVLIEDKSLSHYAMDFLQSVIDANDIFEAPTIISYKKNTSITTLDTWLNIQPTSIIPKSLLALIKKIELKKVRKNPAHTSYGLLLDTQSLNLDHLIIEPDYSKENFTYLLHKNDQKRIQQANLDIIIQFSNHAIDTGSLNLNLGFLTINYGDNRTQRSTPYCFWEVFKNHASTGFSIQKKMAHTHKYMTIFRGNLRTPGTWLLNHAQLLHKSHIFMFHLLKKIATLQIPLSTEAPLPYTQQPNNLPSSKQLLQYMHQTYISFIKEKFLHAIGYDMRWSVSFIKQSGLDISLFKAQTIKNPPRRFLADPFIITHQNKHICFVEDYFYDEKKGKISAYELQEHSYKALGIVLEEDFHLSFPYIFKYESNIYMIPETCGAKDIRIYKSTDFPTKWKLEKILMKNVSAADTIVFKENNKWFMLTNICSANINDHLSELHVFYADHLFSEDWTPLPNNPVIFDSSKARNGGFFSLENKYYRINQVHGKKHYGKSFKINEITSISTDNYIEKEVCHIEPSYFKNILSTHHFHMNEYYTVFDHNRLELTKQ